MTSKIEILRLILTALGISREIGKLWRAIYSRIARSERAILKLPGAILKFTPHLTQRYFNDTNRVLHDNLTRIDQIFDGFPI